MSSLKLLPNWPEIKINKPNIAPSQPHNVLHQEKKSPVFFNDVIIVTFFTMITSLLKDIRNTENRKDGRNINKPFMHMYI